MYYVLFTWIKGKKERDFQGFKTKAELRDFLGKNFEKIMIWNIHKAATNYRFGLVEIENEPEEEEPAPGGTVMCKTKIITAQDLTNDEIRKQKKHPILKDRKEEPSAMEKIADDIEKEKKEDLTEDEIIAANKKALEKTGKAPTVEQTLKRGEKAIKAAELEQSRKKDWPKCPECKGPMAPWNKTGKCATCSHPKGKRPYKRRAKKEEELPF